MVAALSHFGIVFLLFIAGLSLNPRVLKSVGKVSLITGVGQVLFTTFIGFFIAKLLGFSDIAALYIAIALTFSSTIIIVKLLSDKGDPQVLYGRISVGFLIVQDVIAVLILMLISSSTGGFDFMSLSAESILIGLGLLLSIALFGIFGLPRITEIVAKSQELLLLVSIGWLMFLSVVFGYLGFSIEIGALLAGIMLSTSPYHYEIKLKMNILRDFFILFFFVLLGSQMVFINITESLLPIAAFSIFILMGNPLIVMLLMGMMRYTKRNSFLAGLTVAQISEFSLILVALGVRVGHISNEVLSVVTATGLVTILGSTYMIMNANRVYPHISRYLSVFERRGKKVDEHIYHRGSRYDIILFGYAEVGVSMMKSIKNLGRKFLIIDYDPDKITKLAKEGYECRYGDANDTEMLNELDFSKTGMVISTIPDAETNLLLTKKIRKMSKDAIIIIVSHHSGEALKLYESGATYVIMPYFLGGDQASTLIQKHGLDISEFLKERAKHLNHLKTGK
jgi:Kef-type K+ transport system membrane component KefB